MLTRRQLGKLALAVPAAKVFGATSVFGRAAVPDSTIAGVQIGLIAPYSFGRDAPDADTILKYVADIGISGLELQNGPAESFAGAPAEMVRGGGRPPGGPGQRAELTPEQQAERRQAQAALKKWRLSASMDKYKELRKKYSDAGVRIYAFKLALSDSMSDEEYQVHVQRRRGTWRQPHHDGVACRKRLDQAHRRVRREAADAGGLPHPHARVAHGV